MRPPSARETSEDPVTRPSREPVRFSDFGNAWFAQEAPGPSWPPPSVRPPPPPIGDPVWSAVFGAIAGGLAAPTMLIVVQMVLSVTSARADIVRTLAASVSPSGLQSVDPRIIGLACAAVVGSSVGALLCRIARRLLRIGPRLVFFCVLLPILWIFVQAFVLRRFGPPMQLPLGPLLIGAIGYGACLAIVQPVRTREPSGAARTGSHRFAKS